MLWFDASCVAPMLGGRLLIALLALSASPSDCFFAPGSPLQRLVLDFARLLSDFFFTFPFIALSPKTLLDGLSGLLFSPSTHMEAAHEKLQKSLELHTASSDFFCISELLQCLCRKDSLITFYWAVKLWPPMPLAGLAKVREGPFPSCPGLGNGLVDSTSFGSLCPIRSV